MKRKDEMELRGLVGGRAPVRPASSSRVPSSMDGAADDSRGKVP